MDADGGQYLWGDHCSPSEIGRKDEEYSVEAPGEARGPYYGLTRAAETIVRMYML
jgi:hypothetical protein